MRESTNKYKISLHSSKVELACCSLATTYYSNVIQLSLPEEGATFLLRQLVTYLEIQKYVMEHVKLCHKLA